MCVGLRHLHFTPISVPSALFLTLAIEPKQLNTILFDSFRWLSQYKIYTNINLFYKDQNENSMFNLIAIIYCCKFIKTF